MNEVDTTGIWAFGKAKKVQVRKIKRIAAPFIQE